MSPGPPNWDERFSAPEYVYGTAPNDFLAAQAERIPPGEVLCVAEGEGRNAVFLAQRGFVVTAVDSSAVGLRKADDLAQRRGVALKTIVSDLAEFDVGIQRWSGIVSIFAHLPRSVRAPLYASVVRGLRSGGVVILEAYRPEQLRFTSGGPKALELLPRLDDLKRELAGLRLDVAQEVEREVHEGTFHNGLSAVVQVVGVKVGK